MSPKSENVLKTVEKLSSTKLPKGAQIMFTALSEDISNMDERMTKLEKSVDTIKEDVSLIKKSQELQSKQIQELSDNVTNSMILFKTAIELKHRFWSNLFSKPWFWLTVIFFMIIFGGRNIAELSNIITAKL